MFQYQFHLTLSYLLKKKKEGKKGLFVDGEGREREKKSVSSYSSYTFSFQS